MVTVDIYFVTTRVIFRLYHAIYMLFKFAPLAVPGNPAYGSSNGFVFSMNTPESCSQTDYFKIEQNVYTYPL